jgi:hypothetical protein
MRYLRAVILFDSFIILILRKVEVTLALKKRTGSAPFYVLRSEEYFV